MKIFNRRYTGSKYKLIPWIIESLNRHCLGCNSFFDVFGGTGVVSHAVRGMYGNITINDFLFSNNVIYKAFFGQGDYSAGRLAAIAEEYNSLDKPALPANYVSDNFGGKYFSLNDAKLIGHIREDIRLRLERGDINAREGDILLASLLYSFDKVSNTVGHYEAYIKGKDIKDSFSFSLIEPEDMEGSSVEIHREDANLLAPRVECDIAFIDPPYNSRQYSRFYHVMETIVKWDKPVLVGTARKPPEENMSDFCRSEAPKVFADLIGKLKARYIVVTYNNTYTSKSTSSQNKITLEQIREILEARGRTTVYNKSHRAFSAGKTDLADHREYLFITEVGEFGDRPVARSPFFYVGDKYKLMPQLGPLMPQGITDYIEPFLGGGSSFLNTTASRYLLNDINPYVIELHRELQKYCGNFEGLLKRLYGIIDEYGLSCSFRGVTAPPELKAAHPKTYFAKMNKEAYSALKADFNKDQTDTLKLYILLVYGFNHMIRFNSGGRFNLPVGNVDFNKNVVSALQRYLSIIQTRDISFSSMDFLDFLQGLEFKPGCYVYLDPPYLISMSEYNKIWNADKEAEMCAFLDRLDGRGVKFGITNLISHKGKVNNAFREWARKYRVHHINSNYISFNDNTIKENSREIFVSNHE